MRRRLAFLLVQLITIASLATTVAIHAARHDYSATGTERFAWAVAYLVVLVLASYAAGIPDAIDDRSPVLTSLVAATAGALAMSGVQLVVGSAVLPRFVVFGTAGLVTVGWTIVTDLFQRGPDHAGEIDRVVFVGGGLDATAILKDVQLAPERRAKVVATVLPAEIRPIARGEEPLVDLAIDNDATVIVLGRDVQDDRAVVVQASALHESGVRVRSITDFYDEWLGKLPAFELQRMSLMFDISEIHAQSYARVKRLFDFCIGLVGCVVLVPVIPFVWLVNLAANRGSLFYRQPRVGRAGVAFDILKFRTMKPGGSSEWTSEDDPRITPFGRVMRRMHIDELPQFWNIVRGDLSIVGPRPEQPRYVAELVDCLPYYKMRHLVRPGLTGWAQVKYGYAGNQNDALEKLQYDFYYLGHQSLRLDARIVARTIRSTVGRGGR